MCISDRQRDIKVKMKGAEAVKVDECTRELKKTVQAG